MKRKVNSALLRIFSARTLRLMYFDLTRLRARMTRQRSFSSRKLHLGCGARLIDGWLNVDVAGSDYNLDIASALPFPSGRFEAVVSQHAIEHLDLEEELLPLFDELFRVMQRDAEIWLSCPDMAKVCRSYLEDFAQGMLEDRQTRYPDFNLGGAPPQQMVNYLFHQYGEHKNLYDFELLSWALNKAGFTNIERIQEADLLRRFPEFPVRSDDYQSLYVKGIRPAR